MNTISVIRGSAFRTSIHQIILIVLVNDRAPLLKDLREDASHLNPDGRNVTGDWKSSCGVRMVSRSWSCGCCRSWSWSRSWRRQRDITSGFGGSALCRMRRGDSWRLRDGSRSSSCTAGTECAGTRAAGRRLRKRQGRGPDGGGSGRDGGDGGRPQHVVRAMRAQELPERCHRWRLARGARDAPPGEPVADAHALAALELHLLHARRRQQDLTISCNTRRAGRSKQIASAGGALSKQRPDRPDSASGRTFSTED